MKIRCERDALVEALSIAGRAVSSRGASLAVLSGIQLVASENSLRLTGTDLDLSIQIDIPVTTSDIGTCVIPARLITDIVKSLAPGAVTIESDEQEARVSSGKSQFAVRTLDADEYPRVTATEDFHATLPGGQLADALRQVVRAASSDDARPVLTGVLLSAHDAGLRLVATDSYRLAIRDLADAKVLQTDQSVLIPSKALGELARLLNSSEDVNVRLDEQEITFSIGEIRLTSRLIEGQFPDYRSLVPDNYPNRLRVDRDVLLEAVRRVKLLVRDTTTPVRMALRPDSVELTVVSQEIGQATEEVEAKYEGDGITVAFNPAYLIDGLESVPPGDVLIEMLEANKPAMLKRDEGNEFLYLIMPVRVS